MKGGRQRPPPALVPQPGTTPLGPAHALPLGVSPHLAMAMVHRALELEGGGMRGAAWDASRRATHASPLRRCPSPERW